MTVESHHHTPLLRGPTHLARLFARQFICSGDLAIDATCGNGHDTLLLAELVGPTGRVWAFDVQERAIRLTERKLEQAGLTGRVKLVRAGHESLAHHVTVPVRGAMFNLGYLPGGNRDLVTRAETTIPALEQALSLILPLGILAVTVYPGHPGGEREEELIGAWSASLDQRLFHVWHMGQTNAPPTAPHFFLIQKGA